MGTNFDVIFRGVADTSGIAPAFKAEIDKLGVDAKSSLDRSLGGVKKLINDALSVPRTASGSLNLGADQIRDAARAEQARAVSARELAAATRAAFASEKDLNQEQRITILSTDQAAAAFQANADSLNRQAAALETVQRASDDLARSQTANSSRLLADNQAFQALAVAEQLAAQGAERLAVAHRGTALEIGRTSKSAQDSASVFKAAFAQQEQAVKNAAAAQEALAVEAAQLRAALDPTFAGQKRFDDELERADRLLKANAIGQREYAQAVNLARNNLQQSNAAIFEQSDAYRAAEKVSGRFRQANLQIGQQLQDITVGFQSGQRAGTIFAQQLPQLAFAFQGLEGSSNKVLDRLGKIGLLLSGPIGFGVFLALGIAIEAATKAFSADTEEIKRNEKARKQSVDAINSEIEAASKLADIAGDEFKRLALNTEELTRNAKASRNATAAKLALAKADLASVQSQIESGSADPESVSAVLFQAGSRFDRLTKEISGQEDTLRKLEAASTSRLQEVALQRGKLLSTPEGRINDRADAQIKFARAIRGRNTDALVADQDRINKAREKELALIKETEKAQTKASRTAEATAKKNATLTRFINPVDGPITSRFGPRSRLGGFGSSFHEGVDFGVPVGTPVRSPAAGVVSEVGRNSRNGIFVRVNNGGGTETTFLHLSEADVVKGQILEAGEVFAKSGNTGASTGPHLDFRVRVNGKAVDPAKGLFPTDATEVERIYSKESEKSAQILERDLETVARRFDASTAAGIKYEQTLAAIARLSDADEITGDERTLFTTDAIRDLYDAEIKAAEQAAAEIQDKFFKGFQDGFSPLADEAATRLGEEAEAAIRAALDKVAPKLTDNGARGIGALDNVIGRGAGSFLGNLSDRSRDGDKLNPFFNKLGDAYERAQQRLADELNSIFNKVFGSSGKFAELLGGALSGAQTGAQVAGFGRSLGLKTSKAGGQIGGAAGALSGIPGGELIGSVIGSIVGGAFKKTPKGSVSISNTGSSFSGSGKLRSGLTSTGDSVTDTLNSIAEQLGGSVGSFSTSIRQKKNSFFVGNEKFASAQEAAEAATFKLIQSGVIGGLDRGTQALLSSSKDINAGIKKALDFQGALDRIQEATDPLGAAFGRIKREFDGLRRTFTEAGATSEQFAGLAKLEADQRKAALESITASLRDLQRENSFGDTGRSLRDRQAAALAEFNPLEARVKAGDATAFDQFADVGRQLRDINREIFGSQSGYFEFLDRLQSVTNSAIAGQDNIAGLNATAAPVVSAIETQTTMLIAGITQGLLPALSAINDNTGNARVLLGTLVASGGGGARQALPSFQF